MREPRAVGAAWDERDLLLNHDRLLQSSSLSCLSPLHACAHATLLARNTSDKGALGGKEEQKQETRSDRAARKGRFQTRRTHVLLWLIFGT